MKIDMERIGNLIAMGQTVPYEDVTAMYEALVAVGWRSSDPMPEPQPTEIVEAPEPAPEQ